MKRLVQVSAPPTHEQIQSAIKDERDWWIKARARWAMNAAARSLVEKVDKKRDGKERTR
jgi:hypothetical protein